MMPLRQLLRTKLSKLQIKLINSPLILSRHKIPAKLVLKLSTNSKQLLRLEEIRPAPLLTSPSEHLKLQVLLLTTQICCKENKWIAQELKLMQLQQHLMLQLHNPLLRLITHLHGLLLTKQLTNGIRLLQSQRPTVQMLLLKLRNIQRQIIRQTLLLLHEVHANKPTPPTMMHCKLRKKRMHQ